MYDHKFVLITLNQVTGTVGFWYTQDFSILTIQTFYLQLQVYHPTLAFPFCVLTPIQFVDVPILLVFV